MAKVPRISLQGLKILRAFGGAQRLDLSGADICRATGMLSGTIYPLLVRYERAGWLSSKWEDVDPHEVGRPRKRLYRLTEKGGRATREVMRALG